MVVAGSGVASAQSREETARLDAHRYKDAYWQCFADEAVRALPRDMSGTDFAIYIKGRCLSEPNQFRIKMAGYLGIKFPDVAAAERINSADWAITKGD